MKLPGIMPIIALVFLYAATAFAEEKMVLPEILVEDSALEDSERFPGIQVKGGELVTRRAMTNDAAQLLEGVPGANLYTGGGVSSLPVIRGLADDRVKVQTNGMTITSACANHMNPPLSYIDPGKVTKINVMAGITPVSMGGDNTGGTISVESASPTFAGPDEKVHVEGLLAPFFRSNENAYGGVVSVAAANQTFSLGYNGSESQAIDYYDGNGNRVTSTYYKTNNQTLTLGAQRGSNLITIQGGLQNISDQGFVNQQMDMTGNHGKFVNGRYLTEFGWGLLDTRIYWQDVRHEMNMGQDKQQWLYRGTMLMPMNTHGQDFGYVIKAELPLATNHTVRLGNEFHKFILDDWWPPVADDGSMGPHTFININNGQRNRVGTFAEWEAKWTDQWTTLLGIRNDTVWMDTDNVHGYSDKYAADALAFNLQSHGRTDVNLDLTALVRYAPNSASDYEAGYARKTRTPNLYERYAWSTDWMASGMVNWFGDGNSYVGNLDLKPEVAHTVSATASWHDSGRKEWEVKITPYYTYVEDYIGVDLLESRTMGLSTFSLLKFANHDAQIYGVDLSGNATLWDNAKFGRGRIKGVVGWLQGTTSSNNYSLYHMMPLNARLTLEETLFNAWKSSVEIQLVDSKSAVDPLRREPETPAYCLVNLHSSYQWHYVRLDVGVTNLFDRYYYLPLGGVNMDNYLATNWNGALLPLAGQGRSFYAGLTMKF